MWFDRSLSWRLGNLLFLKSSSSLDLPEASLPMEGPLPAGALPTRPVAGGPKMAVPVAVDGPNKLIRMIEKIGISLGK